MTDPRTGEACPHCGEQGGTGPCFGPGGPKAAPDEVWISFDSQGIARGIFHSALACKEDAVTYAPESDQWTVRGPFVLRHEAQRASEAEPSMFDLRDPGWPRTEPASPDERRVEERLVVTDLCDMHAFHREGRLGQVLRRAINFIEGRECFPAEAPTDLAQYAEALEGVIRQARERLQTLDYRLDDHTYQELEAVLSDMPAKPEAESPRRERAEPDPNTGCWPEDAGEVRTTVAVDVSELATLRKVAEAAKAFLFDNESRPKARALLLAIRALEATQQTSTDKDGE